MLHMFNLILCISAQFSWGGKNDFEIAVVVFHVKRYDSRLQLFAFVQLLPSFHVCAKTFLQWVKSSVLYTISVKSTVACHKRGKTFCIFIATNHKRESITSRGQSPSCLSYLSSPAPVSQPHSEL